MLPFQRESVCKDKAFFLSIQIFPKFFFEKVFSGRPRGAYPFLAPLRPCKVRYSGAAPSASLPLFTSLSSSAALPLESGCKGTHFFRFCNFYAILFWGKFEDFFVNHCKQDGCRWTFFDAFKNGRKQPYIMYFARACVRTHACTRADKQEEACTR